ncbi:MAG: hypothetical protein ACXQS8_03770, partial [Candidatus Helarchaeales archaeon]
KECEPLSDSRTEPVKYSLKPRRINLKIPLTEIRDLEIGHDDIFGRRHQIYPKLIVTLKNKTWYFILLNETLIAKKETVQQDAEKFKARIEELKTGKKPVKKPTEEPTTKKIKPKVVKPKPTIVRPKPTTVKPEATPTTPTQTDVPVASVVETKATIQEGTTKLSNIEKLKKERLERMKAIEAKKEPAKPSAKPAAKLPPQPIEKKKSVKEILEERTEEARKKAPKMPKVAPYQPTAKAYAPVAQTYKKAVIEEKEHSFTDKILDDITESIDIDVLDYELNTSYADTSVNRCPHCGWMLAWNAKKCPKCKKSVIGPF